MMKKVYFQKTTHILLGFLLFWIPYSEGLQCPHPPNDINTKVTAPDLTPGSVATYSCDSGFTLFGSSSRVCGEDGKWSGDIPLCATNIAIGKPVNQSSTADGSQGEFANDNDFSTTENKGKCAKTMKEASPWWSVDLLQEYEVSVIKITTDCCGGNALQNLEIRVGDSVNLQNNRLCTWFAGTIDEGTTKELNCHSPMKGRYVFIQLVGGEASMSICEVQVFSKEEFSLERCSESRTIQNLGTFNRTCYEFQVKYGGAFESARKHCQEYGGDLIQNLNDRINQKYISSELERLKPKMTADLLWIGAQKEPHYVSRTWRWVNGDEIKRPRWAKEQPNNYNGKQNCITLDGTKNWFWNDVGCELNYLHWICQFQPALCGSPDKKENSTVEIVTKEVENTLISTNNAIYKCPLGHKIVGPENRTCVDGFWSDEAPACEYVNCGEPTAIEHGKFVLLDQRTNYGSRVLYECADNYTLDGTETLTCNGVGNKWAPETPKCLYSWCPEIEAPSNGGVQSSGRKIGDTAEFTCDLGHKLLGYSNITCMKGGIWSESIPVCRFIDCGLPLDVEHGKMVLANTTTYIDSVAIYECGPDHWLDGPSIRKCQENEKWSGNQPVCKPIDCGEPEIPPAGFVTGFSFSVHSEVEYYCEEGHYLQGDNIRVCTRAGIWSGGVPQCIFVDCGEAEDIKNGKITYNNEVARTILGSAISYSCVAEYELNGTSTRTCLQSGKWSGDAPTCEEIRCGDAGEPENGKMSVTGNKRRFISTISRGREHMILDNTYKIGSRATYRCNGGYVLEGPNTRHCRPNGQWSGRPTICKYVDCGPLEKIDHGSASVNRNTTSFGSVGIYTCDENWKIENGFSSRRYCQENGTWSGTTPTCTEITCPTLKEDLELNGSSRQSRHNARYTVNNQEITNELSEENPLIVDEGDRKVGTKAKFSCSVGRLLVGTEFRECEKNGIWSGTSPRCEWVSCKQPEDIINGRVIRGSKSLIYGSVVEYLCFPKYRLIGNFNRTCTEKGTWSGQTPLCTLDPIDYGILNGNDIDNIGNSARGGHGPGVRQEASNTGMYVGIGVSLVLTLVVGLALFFFKTRQTKISENERAPPSIKQQENGVRNEAMSYADLNDPTTGNNIYENIPEDAIDPYANINRNTSGSSIYSNQSGTYSSNGRSHIYSNSDISSETNKVPYNMAQRPRMPPPQPPTVPESYSSVTINGVSVNSS